MQVAVNTYGYQAAVMDSASLRARFQSLLEQHGGIIRKIAFSYARNENDRKDLIQDIVLQLWKSYPRYSPERSFSTWLYRIALNVSISFLRQKTRAKRETVEFDESIHQLVHERPPSGSMEERMAMLQQVITTFQPLDRALLLLYLEDRSYRDIATVLGLTETNVATKLYRLKERLRRELTTRQRPIP